MKDKAALKKNNKEEKNITFVSFEDRNMTLEDIRKKQNRKNNKIEPDKEVLKKIFFILIVIILFVLSSVFNNYILYGNDSNYITINEYPGNYAIINYDERSDLFKNIGFELTFEKEETMRNKKYDVTYAYHKNKDKNDWISVYYDEQGKVKYITLTLNYKEKDYKISKLVGDTNGVINNFVNTRVSQYDLRKLNSTKHVVVDNRFAKLTYDLTLSNDYYIVSITVE